MASPASSHVTPLENDAEKLRLENEKKPSVVVTDVKAISLADLQDGDEALQLIDRLGYTPANFHELEERFDDAYYRRLTWKIDAIILPLLAGTYMLQFLDKNLLNYAAIMGLQEDTGLKGTQYSSIAAAFYWGFLAWEFPTVWLAQKSGMIGTYLGGNLILWGICLGATAACHNFGELFATRFLLGVFESCVAPILIMIVSMWYPKYSQGRRVAVFYCMNGLTEIFGAAVAYGLSSTTLTFASWRLLYLIFGIITVIHGVLCVLFLPNSPVRAKFFSDEQKLAILLKNRNNQSGTQNRKWKFHQILEIFRDPKVLCNLLLVLLTSTPNGGISNYTSLLIKGFGFSSRQSLLLQMPHGVIALITTLVVGWLSDLTHERSLIVALCCLLPTIGGAMLVNGGNGSKGFLLTAYYLTSTFGSSFSICLSYNASNIGGATKRLFANAITMVCFSLGNIAGSYTFPTAESPDYHSGKITIMACLAAAVVFAVVLRYLNALYNRKHREDIKKMDQSTVDRKREEAAFADLSDLKNPFFSYTK